MRHHRGDGTERIYAAVCLMTMGCSVALYAGVKAYAEPFWFDEICTLIVSRLPDWSQTWRALLDGVDTNPPTYYALIRLSARIFDDEQLALRVPSILAFMALPVLVYSIVASSADRFSALTAAAFTLVTPVAGYAREARPYALMLAAISLALLSWRRADQRRLYQVIFGASLTAALCLHYYAVLVWPAFIAGELVFTYLRRRVRIGLWVAMIASALVPLLAFRGHLAAVRSYYGQYFWAQPSWVQLLSGPGFVLTPDSSGLLLTIGLAVAILVWMRRQGRHDATAASAGGDGVVARHLPPEYGAVLLGLLSVPIIGLLVATVMGGGMSERYMFPSLIGASAALGYAVSYLPVGARVTLMWLLVAVYIRPAVDYVARASQADLKASRMGGVHWIHNAIRDHIRPGDQVVMSSAMDIVALTHYAGGRFTPVALLDPHEAVRYTGSDSADLALAAVRKYYPIQAIDYRDYIAEHPSFLLVSTGGEFDWWTRRLVEDGRRLLLLTAVDGVLLFRVTALGE